MIETAPVETPDAGARLVKHKPVRLRAVLPIALGLIVLNTGWIANSEMKTGVTEITISTLFLGVTFILFLVTLINLAVRRMGGAQTALNQAELMLLYSLLSISSAVAGVGNIGFFAPFLANPFWYANNANGWRVFWHLLPPYIGPRDPAVLRGFYEGHSSFFQAAVLGAWAMPLLVWGVFFLVLLWITLCTAALVRRRWTEEEHLPFPVIVLPLEMTRENAPIYRNKLLWAGFALPACLHSLNSLHSLFPRLPFFPINSAPEAAAALPYPWNGIGQTFLPIHAAGIGFGYLINLDMLFSLWFFYILRKAVNLWGTFHGLHAAGIGFDGARQFPYTIYQSWGAWLALGLAILWQGRRGFADYLRRALTGDPQGHDRGEPMSARAAVIGIGGGFAGLCVFVWSSGGSWWLPPLFLGIYLVLMLVLTRIQAEIATPSSLLSWVDPQNIISGLAGTTQLAPMDTIHLGMLSWFNSDYRAAPMPHQLQSFVGQERAGSGMRHIPALLMLAAAVALIASFCWDLQLYYVNGAATGRVNPWRIAEGSVPWSAVQYWLLHPTPPDGVTKIGMVCGALVTGALSLLRTRFVGFPLSPLGYVIDTTWANDLFWLDMFIAWSFKSLILRYGGMQSYRFALPFFLGLILGDFVAGALWSVVGTLLHLELFRTFSN